MMDIREMLSDERVRKRHFACLCAHWEAQVNEGRQVTPPEVLRQLSPDQQEAMLLLCLKFLPDQFKAKHRELGQSIIQSSTECLNGRPPFYLNVRAWWADVKTQILAGATDYVQ